MPQKFDPAIRLTRHFLSIRRQASVHSTILKYCSLRTANLLLSGQISNTPRGTGIGYQRFSFDGQPLGLERAISGEDPGYTKILTATTGNGFKTNGFTVGEGLTSSGPFAKNLVVDKTGNYPAEIGVEVDVRIENLHAAGLPEFIRPSHTGGQLSITDINPGEALFNAATVLGTHGSLTITSDGSWRYEVDNEIASVQSLVIGETLTDTVTVTSLDGTAQDIAITINSMNNAAVIGGKVSGSSIEDTIGNVSFSPLEFTGPFDLGFADFSLGAVEPTNINEFTVEMWIKPDVGSTGILRFSDPLQTGFGPPRIMLTDGRPWFQISPDEDQDLTNIFFRPFLADGNWHHIAVTSDGDGFDYSHGRWL